MLKKFIIILNKMLTLLLGLKIVRARNNNFKLRVHPYPRIKRISEKLFLNNHLTIFEVGGWKGQLVDFFITFPNKKDIYLFEPNPKAYSFLVEKYKNDNNTKIFDFGLYNQNVRKNIFITQKDNLASLIEPKNDNQSLKIVSTNEVDLKVGDEFIEENQIKNIDILSINTQGTEKEILDGLQRSLAKDIIKSIIIEIDFSNRYKKNSFYNIESVIHKHGYELYDINLIKGKNTDKFSTGISVLDCFYISSSLVK